MTGPSKPAAGHVTDRARMAIEVAEVGDTAGADLLDQARATEPAAAAAAEQEAADGPEGRGVAR